MQVDHPAALRAPAFSVAIKVVDYEIRDADSPDFFALITRAELTELSITDRPANANALIP